jgi:hypothetical protein
MALHTLTSAHPRYAHRRADLLRKQSVLRGFLLGTKIVVHPEVCKKQLLFCLMVTGAAISSHSNIFDDITLLTPGWLRASLDAKELLPAQTPYLWTEPASPTEPEIDKEEAKKNRWAIIKRGRIVDADGNTQDEKADTPAGEAGDATVESKDQTQASERARAPR